MTRISGVTIKQLPKQYTLSVRKTIDFMKEYAAFAGQALEKTMQHMEALGRYPISGPMVCFHNTELEKLDVEMGWTLAEPAEGADGVAAGVIPAGRVATAIDQGPYEEQDPTLMDIYGWMAEHGHEAQGPIYYYYLNETDRPENEYLTQMAIPLK